MEKTTHILLVDDHAVVLQGLAKILSCESDFCVVGGAGTSAEALQMLRDHTVDVVILDLVLGDESGLTLLKRIASEFAKVPVLVLSMHEDRLYAERAIRAGAKGYVTKSEATETLIAAVRNVVAGRLHLSEAAKTQMIERVAASGKQFETGSVIDTLTNRELEVLRFIAQCKTTAQIAAALNRSVKTIEAHKSALKLKLNVHSAPDLMRAAVEHFGAI